MGLSSSKLSDSRIKLQPEQILSLAQSHKQNMYELHEKISKQFEDLHTSRFSILENIQTAKIVEWKKFSRDRLTKADNLLRRIYILYQNFLRFKNPCYINNLKKEFETITLLNQEFSKKDAVFL